MYGNPNPNPSMLKLNPQISPTHRRINLNLNLAQDNQSSIHKSFIDEIMELPAKH
jgi:hypothetical protein